MSLTDNGAVSQQIAALKRSSLRDQALVALRAAITTGEIPAGSRLVETQLSRELSISRGTLREALRQLQQEGLVVEDARAGLNVRQLNPAEIHEVFEVRSALESLAARLLCASEDLAPALATLNDRVEDMRRAESAPMAERMDADVEFHRTLCRLSGNGALQRAWESLEGFIRMSIMFAGADRALQNMAADRHQEIVDAIATEDPAHTDAVVHAHTRAAVVGLVGNAPTATRPTP